MPDESQVIHPAGGTAIKSLPRLAESETATDIDAEFVEKLIQKTEEGKISWVRNGEGHSGRSTDGALRIELTEQTVPIFGRTWKSFHVHTGGKEILLLKNDSNGLLSLAGVANSAAHRKVSALMAYLESARVRQVRSALAALDKL